MTVGHYESNLDGAGVRVGIVQARFNENVGAGLLDSCLQELRQLGVMDEDILHVTVPGALEVPLALQKLAATHQFDALIALWCWYYARRFGHWNPNCKCNFDDRE